ncbi:MAG TPA: hypothetical protein VKI64_02470, partial [Acidimicrobiales bacterium]|nr:hypothetical protein [Acidimicrobiales bacterium]
MTGVTPGGSSLGWKELFDRYGPTAIVVVALSLLVALLPGNTSGRGGTSVSANGNGGVPEGGTVPGAVATGQQAGASGSATGGGGVLASGTAAAGQASGVGAPGAASGSSVAFGKGPNCRSDG